VRSRRLIDPLSEIEVVLWFLEGQILDLQEVVCLLLEPAAEVMEGWLVPWRLL
jgi:hypothetical protein